MNAGGLDVIRRDGGRLGGRAGISGRYFGGWGEKGEREKRGKRGERAGKTGERNGKRKRKHDKRMGRRIDGMNGKKEAADGATIDGANPRPGRTGSPSGAIKKGR